ncbi:ribosomal RNA methyltransferase RrmJ/FtsJ [Methanosalsum zhilinae DSM 4017]|uniref:Ribosomal RNA large subunit methyltransferase E n=1 Tax=Methanosalsum zhilinae (strain DSM 4017 / NBRC 107636 / OCM 62 / WeN5) TaxID=679901 RepID=F7XPT7_METZD|nr:23S rRNA (uridine(2552)-2'-O)-methyltransferase [Methanosalsum zhilinae]AEH60364.1 ribosomal RNA methyltransferase RrmJ/FtsJ [Methanosalsum zhilinae DSM 4017]
MARNQRDRYYWLAKSDGYRSRASYKLQQINKKFNVIKRNDTVVDLGAAPGGWLQVARELSGGKVVGVDLRRIKPIESVDTIKGDITSESTVNKILDLVGEHGADVVICDAAPNMSGNWSLDHARSIDLANSAFECSQKILRPGGNFVVKVFQGDMFKEFIDRVKSEFVHTKAYNPEASRSQSAEIYVIGKKMLSTPVKRGDIYEVRIESKGSSGDGVGSIDGFVVFVKDAEVGEKLRVKVRDVRPNFAFADVVERLDNPSDPSRK